jgi:UDP-GlcNAc3NAcA epimerase
MYDVLLSYREKARAGSILRRLGLSEGNYNVASVHRAGNTDDDERLARILSYLEAQSRDLPLVMPLHPRTRIALARVGIELSGIRTVEPLGYLDMLGLLDGAHAVFTDSGGLQKEAYFLNKPCVTLREETEWPETIAAGWNRLWTEPHYLPRRSITDFGDGRAGSKICDVLMAAMVER